MSKETVSVIGLGFVGFQLRILANKENYFKVIGISLTRIFLDKFLEMIEIDALVSLSKNLLR